MKHVNLQTERSVLVALLDCEGPLLKSTAEALLGACGLSGSDFATPSLRAWFEAIRTLASRDRPVDASTVWSVSRGMLGVPQDGFAQLSELQGANGCNLEALLTHAQELRRLGKLRQLESFHRDQLNALQGERPDPSRLALEVDAFSKKFSGAEEDFGTGADDLLELSEEWEATVAGARKPFLPTGIEALDAVIMGWEENINIVGGPPSAGKSALISSAIYNALCDGHRICLFGLEDGTKWIAKRLLSRQTSIPIKHVGKIPLPEYRMASVHDAMGELANPLRNLLTYKHGGLGSGRLLQLCKKAIAVYKTRAIFIDHGLEVQHESSVRGDELRMRVQHTFAQLRDLAFTTHTPIIVIVHFNREQAKTNGPPTMSQFAECAGIERMARLALGLWERPEKDGAGQVRCTVMKQTEGEKNVHLILRRETTHALIANAGGYPIDLKAEDRPRSWREGAKVVGGNS